MSPLIKIGKPLTLVVLVIIGTYYFSIMDTFCNACGYFCPTGSNQATDT